MTAHTRHCGIYRVNVCTCQPVHPFGGSSLVLTYPLPPHAPSFVCATTPPITPPPKAPPMIDPLKQYQTRDGREVRIYATDGCAPYTVHGAIQADNGGGWGPGRWLPCGGGSLAFSDQTDLVEKPKTIRVDYWLNVYPSPTQHLPDRESADARAAPNRIACVRVERDVTVGEGL